MTTPAPADKKSSALDLLKGFLAEHPELISEITAAAAALASGPPTPLTLFGVVHELIDAHNGPIDMERRQQMHDAVSEHEAQIAELVAGHAAAAATSPAAAPVSSPVSSPSSTPDPAPELPLDSDQG